MLTHSVKHNFQNLRYFRCPVWKIQKLIKSKPTRKRRHANSILEYFEYFCQMSSKSILIILSYTVSKLAHFFWDTVYIDIGQFFLGGWAIFAQKVFNSTRKTAMLTCKITSPDSPHPIIISKNPGFLNKWNEFRLFLFNKDKNIYFFIFCCWHLPEEFLLLPENNSFTRVWGLKPPSLLVRMPTVFYYTKPLEYINSKCNHSIHTRV